MKLRGWLLLLLLCSGPARADLERAQRLLRHHLFDEALAAARPDLRSANRSRRFEAETICISALTDSLCTRQAVQRWQRLQRVDRRDLDSRALRAFCLLDYQLNQSETSLDKALEFSRTPAEQIVVLLEQVDFQLDQGEAERAEETLRRAGRLAGENRLEDDLLGLLSLRRMAVDRAMGRAQDAWTDLAQAQRFYEHSGDRAGLSGIWKERANLAADSGTSNACLVHAVQALEGDRYRLLQLLVLSHIADRGWDLNQKRGQRLQAELTRLKRPGLSAREQLLVHRIQARLVKANGTGRQAWLDQTERWLRRPPAGLEWETRLLCYTSRAQVQFSTLGESVAQDLRRACELAEQEPPHGSDDLLSGARPGRLRSIWASWAYLRGEPLVAEKQARLCLQQAGDDIYPKMEAWQVLLVQYLQMARLDEAEATIADLRRAARAARNPVQRALCYFYVCNSMLGSYLDAVEIIRPAPLRLPPSSSAGLLLQRLRQDPEAIREMLLGLERWSQLEERRQDASSLASAKMIYAVFLGCLDRPLDAISVYQQALQSTAQHPRPHANLAYLLSRELYGQGKKAEALAQILEAYQICRRNGLLEMSQYGLQAASLQLELGQSRAALALVRTLRNHWQGQSGKPNPIALLLEARALRALEQPESARDSLDQALIAMRQVPNLEVETAIHLERGEPQELLQAWQQVRQRALTTALSPFALRLGEGLERQGQGQAALQLYDEALADLAERRQQLPAEARRQFVRVTELSRLLQQSISLALRLGRQSDAERQLALGRAFEFQEAAQGSRPAQPELEDLRAQLVGLQTRLDSASVPDREALNQRLASTRAQFLTTLNRLRRENPNFDESVAAQGSELLALQPQLGPETLLLQYYAAPEALYIQALRRDSLRLEVVRIEQSRLESLIRDWNAALSRPSAAFPNPEQRRIQQELYAALLAPVSDLVGQAGRLLVLPSGQLWSLPLESLQDDRGRFLIESCPVSYLANADLLRLAAPPERAPLQLVALSNSDLAGSQIELDELGRLFPGANLLRGEQASLARLESLAPQAGVLHLATHSQPRPDNPNDSFLELHGGDLRLSQIYGLQLPEGALVVLSSCQSGVGQTRPERELVALSTGFRAAGASSVISSLWRVDDEVTGHFFPPMYRHLLQGESRSAGLRAAKLEMLADPAHRHPFYWAGFTLLGDPR